MNRSQCNFLVWSLLSAALIVSGYNAEEKEPWKSGAAHGKKSVMESLAGEYHVDVVFGSTRLTLHSDGAFSCVESDCTGISGEAGGRWSVKRKVVKFHPEWEWGSLEDYLNRARIIEFQGHSLLVLEQDEEFFQEYGPSSFCCLHRPEADSLFVDDLFVFPEPIRTTQDK